MTVNPLGAVVVFDGENPRTFTGKARVNISAGDLVVVSGAATNLSSGADSFATSDIVVDIIHDSRYCNGIAVTTSLSGTNVTFATRGAYIVRSAGVISGGQIVTGVSGTTQGVTPADIITVTSGTVSSTGTYTPKIGRAITAAASGTNLFTLVDLNI